MRREVDGGTVVAEFPVPESGDVIVLLDPDQRPAGVLPWHPFQNVLRLSSNGEIIWRAELVPGESTAKCWMRIEFDHVLTAWTWSYVCELDPDTGRIVNSTFTK
jgi:hypothetical protein